MVADCETIELANETSCILKIEYKKEEAKKGDILLPNSYTEDGIGSVLNGVVFRDFNDYNVGKKAYFAYSPSSCHCFTDNKKNEYYFIIPKNCIVLYEEETKE